MKVTSEHLEQVRLTLIEKNAALTAETKAASEAITSRNATSASVRGLLDIFAASYAQDGELSSAQLNDLPSEAQTILGYAPKAESK